MAGAAGIRRKMPQRPPPPPSVLPPRPSNTLPRRPFYVDREKTCPLLLRVFTKVGSHHSREDFAVRGQEPKNEFQIYTWKDATLRELTDLVKEVTPAARRRDARLSFAFVFPEKQGHLVVRPVGKTFSYGSGEMDDGKALAQLGFQSKDPSHLKHQLKNIASMNGWGGHNYAHESRDPKWQPYDIQEALELNVWGKDHVYNQSFPKHGDDGGGHGSGNPYHGHHTMYGDDGAYGYGRHDHHAMYGGYGGGYGYYDQGYYH